MKAISSGQGRGEGSAFRKCLRHAYCLSEPQDHLGL